MANNENIRPVELREPVMDERARLRQAMQPNELMSLVQEHCELVARIKRTRSIMSRTQDKESARCKLLDKRSGAIYDYLQKVDEYIVELIKAEREELSNAGSGEDADKRG